jgi:tRNA G10  N-methylase Trm11
VKLVLCVHGYEGMAGYKPVRRYYLGRLIGNADTTAARTFDLTARPYIGTTSMDPEMALVMANQAQVARASWREGLGVESTLT